MSKWNLGDRVQSTATQLEGTVTKIDGDYVYFDNPETGRKHYEFANYVRPICPAPISKFESIAEEIGKMTTAKNIAYGNSAARSGKILTILYPAGVAVEQYQDMLLAVRVIDKLSRVATKKDPTGEPWRDIGGYGILGAALALAGENE